MDISCENIFMNCRLCMETIEMSRYRDINSKTVSIKESENVYVW